MLKIIDIHTSETPNGEYVVLQNHGLTTLSLRGWALCDDIYLTGNAHDAAYGMYIFSDDVPIKPYTRVVLFTGVGVNGWHPTVDGKYAYLVYWGRNTTAWESTENVHLLNMSASRKVTPTRTEVRELIGA